MTDNLELPGIPPLSKKRGRPPTGKAKTAAQRKADSRARVKRMILLGPIYDSDTWILSASPSQLLEVYPVLLRSRPLNAAVVAQRLVEIAREASA